MVIESSASWLVPCAMYRGSALFASDSGENEAPAAEVAWKAG
jgi:hypothetical protein